MSPWRMPMSRRSVESAGAVISYLDSRDDGAPVVILHGLAGSASEFIPTAEALDEYRVILIDQRGHGHSTRAPLDTSRTAFVADVVRVIETEALGPVSLVGQSMGAHTAMLTAASRPDLVERLMLLEGGEGTGNLAENATMGDYFQSWPVPRGACQCGREMGCACLT
jgi:pimeloyl-ACP methyl ester carboxylesterase